MVKTVKRYQEKRATDKSSDMHLYVCISLNKEKLLFQKISYFYLPRLFKFSLKKKVLRSEEPLT